jgi:AraC-like DNA-binding protein
MEKPRIIETDAEYIYIPPDCSEHYLMPAIKHISSDPYKMWIAGQSILTAEYKAHRHPASFNVLIYSINGAGCIEENGRIHEAHPHDVIIAPTGHTYSYYPTAETWEIVWIHLNNSPEWNRLIGTEITTRNARCAEQIKPLVEIGLRENVTQMADSAHAIHLAVEHIIFYIKRELMDDPVTTIPVRKSLENGWITAQGNLQQQWTIEDLSRLNNCSKTKFHSLCKQTYGKTPMNILLEMRMEKAMKLLTFTTNTLDVIAETVGYDNAFTFSRAFYRHAGIRPNEYRKKSPRPNPE